MRKKNILKSIFKVVGRRIFVCNIYLLTGCTLYMYYTKKTTPETTEAFVKFNSQQTIRAGGRIRSDHKYV